MIYGYLRKSNEEGVDSNGDGYYDNCVEPVEGQGFVIIEENPDFAYGYQNEIFNYNSSIKFDFFNNRSRD